MHQLSNNKSYIKGICLQLLRLSQNDVELSSNFNHELRIRGLTIAIKLSQSLTGSSEPSFKLSGMDPGLWFR